MVSTSTSSRLFTTVSSSVVSASLTVKETEGGLVTVPRLVSLPETVGSTLWTTVLLGPVR